MLEIIVNLPDGRHFVIEAQGKSIGTVATQAATQIDAHRELGTYTLVAEDARKLPPDEMVDLWLKHGAKVTLLRLIPPASDATPAAEL